MVVGMHPEAIEGEPLNLLSGHLAEDVDRHAAVLPNLPPTLGMADCIFCLLPTHVVHRDCFRLQWDSVII